MAQPVTTLGNRPCARLIVLLAFGLTMPAAFAENLPDPTRPSGAAYADGAAADANSGPVLQSVLNSSGRKIAIISGQSVKQGDLIGSARVVRIADTEVVLAQGREKQVLKLFPVLEKQPSASRPAPKHGMRQ